jgi:hypothetical protein
LIFKEEGTQSVQKKAAKWSLATYRREIISSRLVNANFRHSIDRESCGKLTTHWSTTHLAAFIPFQKELSNLIAVKGGPGRGFTLDLIDRRRRLMSWIQASVANLHQPLRRADSKRLNKKRAQEDLNPQPTDP